MANRYPLIVDTSDSNKIKEIPVGDNLNLAGCGIINATSISSTGTITAQSITVAGDPLASVATSGDYNDLINTPSAFSGSYNDLTNKPTIPTNTRSLSDVQPAEPNDKDILQYNSLNGRYEPTSLTATIDISLFDLGQIGNVITTGDTTNKFLKYYSGAWRAANVTYAEVQSAPTRLSDLINDLTVSDFDNDAGYSSDENTDAQELSFLNGILTITGGNSIGINEMDLVGSVFADNSTLLVDAVNARIVGDTYATVYGNVYSQDGLTQLVDAGASLIVGNVDNTSVTTDSITLGAGGTITGGASGIGITPTSGGSFEINVTNEQIVISNDPEALQADSNMSIKSGNALNITSQGSLTIESSSGNTTMTVNQLDVNSTGVVTVDGNGIEITSSSSQIQLNGPEVSITAAVTLEGTSSLQVGNFTTAERDALTAGYGMIIYNTSTNKFQGFRDIGGGGTWVDLH